MLDEMINRYAVSVPRYTSYPTAPHFSADVGEQAQASWLAAVPADGHVSLYVHIPYCDRLCWFCGCNTKQIQRYDPVATYLGHLHREIAKVGTLLAKGATVTALHFGGGSPTMLAAADILELGRRLKAAFTFAPGAEISVEMDPNDMTDDRFDAFASIGMTRASLGVQDFDPRVQAAINREQTFEQTKAVVDAVRARGVGSVNLDILYGLPHQTVDSVAATVRACLEMDPDRIALFGYAHVPWMKKHQTMIGDEHLPGTVERYRQQEHAAEILVAAGYEIIGIDHFAKPGDSMAIAARNGTLRRNFQGYTVDDAETLVGLGTSAISQYREGYIQNSPATADYQRRVEGGGLAAVRGYALTATDRMRAAVIERLMCDFGFSRSWVKEHFGEAGKVILDEADYLAASNQDGFFLRDGDQFRVSEAGRPFVRVLASHFDEYFGRGTARHSAAV